MIGHSLQALYRELAELSPALVVIEDIDLTVGGRGSGGGSGLIDFSWPSTGPSPSTGGL